MDRVSKFKRKFWIKMQLLVVAATIYCAFICYLFDLLLGEEFDIRIALPVFIAILIFLPFFVAKFSKQERKRISEFLAVEDSFERSGDDLLISTFGDKIYEKLYVDDLNLVPFNGIDLCKELLSKNASKNNDELRFHLYIKIAKFYFKDGSYSKAQEYLKKSLSIKPTSFIANFRIAEIFENLGSGEDAILHYEAALKSGEIMPIRLLGYVNSQIHRVKTKGPSVKGAPRGLKWMAG